MVMKYATTSRAKARQRRWIGWETPSAAETLRDEVVACREAGMFLRLSMRFDLVLARAIVSLLVDMGPMTVETPNPKSIER
jgi:hypothetical protein